MNPEPKFILRQHYSQPIDPVPVCLVDDKHRVPKAMNRSTILSLLLAAAVIVPAAAAGIGSQSKRTQTADAASSDITQTASNYTQLYVEEQYRSLELKPGESDTVSIEVENGEDEAVTITPHLYTPKVGSQPIKQDWVSISEDEVTLAAGQLPTTEVVGLPVDIQSIDVNRTLLPASSRTDRTPDTRAS